MLPVFKALALFVVIELTTITVWANVEINCPSIPGPPSTKPSTPFVPDIYTSPLNPSCFGIDIKLNVDNILPDPSFISRETNINIIQNVLAKTLTANNINSFHINPVADTWSNINNRCPQSQDQTVQKFILQNTPYEISCDESTLILNKQFIQCQFTTPTSTAYMFNIASITSFIHLNPNGVYGIPVDIAASIMTFSGTQLFVSDTNTIVHTQQNQEFVFSQTTETISLAANTKYKLRIFIISSGTNKYDIEFESIHKVPVLHSIAQASPCVLANNVAVSKSMKFAVQALCNSSNALPAHKNELERVLYQKSSAQTLLSTSNVFQVRRRTLNRHGNGKIHAELEGRDRDREDDCTCSGDSLHCTFGNSTTITIANDTIFPYYRQCVAVDIQSNRVFSVGGEYMDGKAKNELKIYQIESLKNAKLISDNILLDRARTGSMCYFWNEFIVVINGMDHANDMYDDTEWYNDIVFIPLDASTNNIIVPQIKLKHNVMDMRAVITETNILYLFGGRDAVNAQNYIQSVDLNDVIVGVDSNDVFTTVDRMGGMVDNVVIPFIDFVNVNNKSCMMIFGGQNYVNKEWISIDIPSERLELICNDNIKINRNLIPVHKFSEFDAANVESISAFDSDITSAHNIFMTDYNFENDNIWYEFSASFEVCLPAAELEYNEEYLTTVLNLFEQDMLVDNILYESQRNFREWNNGFSGIEISHINFLRKASMESTDYCTGLSASVCDGLVIAQNGGDQECAYNDLSKECYSIERQLAAGNINGKSYENNSHVKSLFYSFSHAKMYWIIGVLSGIIVLLLLFICVASCYVYKDKRNKGMYSFRKTVSMSVADVDHVTHVNTNSIL